MSLPYEHTSRRGDAVHLRIIAGRRVDEFLGYHAVVNDLLIGIDVVQIGVQRLHTLLKACFKTVELIGFDDARHGIIGEQPIVIFAVLVYAEMYTITAELAIDLLAPGYQLLCQCTCRLFDHSPDPFRSFDIPAVWRCLRYERT